MVVAGTGPDGSRDNLDFIDFIWLESCQVESPDRLGNLQQLQSESKQTNTLLRQELTVGFVFSL